MPIEPACTPPRRVDARERPGTPHDAWPLYDRAATRTIERAALASRPAHQLMARAGLAVARLALSLAEPGCTFWIAAGPGNNGGDGLVAATWLRRWGQPVRVSLCARRGRLPEDAAWALRRAEEAGVPITELEPRLTSARIAAACPTLPQGAWIIDALLGLGLGSGLGRTPAPRDDGCTDSIDTLTALIHHLQHLRRTRDCQVLAVDLPSGLDADTGRPGYREGSTPEQAPLAVVADHTLSLLTLKPGLCTGEGPHHAGQLWWHGLGVVPAPDRTGRDDPTAAPEAGDTCRRPAARSRPTAPAAGADTAPPAAGSASPLDRAPLPRAWRIPAPRWSPRQAHRHKGSYGDVLVLGGAEGMGGAALLAADAALQAGGGRVWIGRPEGHGDGCATDHRPVDPPPLPQPLPPELMQAAMHQLCSAERLARSTVVCGCGGGTALHRWLAEVLRHAHRLVLDADALNAVAADKALRHLLHARAQRSTGPTRWPTLLTPHPLEAARLLGTDTATVQADRVASACQLARSCSAVVLLKGSGTVVATPDGTAWINPRGSARLATPGSGDVLAGWIGGTWSACGDAAAAQLWAVPPDTDEKRPGSTGPPPGHARHPAEDPTLAVAAACAWLHGRAGESPPLGMPLRAGELARAMAALSGQPPPSAGPHD
jgi:hydroxyethylthiazole kinase-like uncharacterized protein yjeF